MPTTKPTTVVYVDLVNEEKKEALLGFVEAKSIPEAEKYIAKNYPDYKILEITEGTRLKL